MTKTRHVLHALSSIAMLAFVIWVLDAQAAPQDVGESTTSNGPVVHDLPPNVPGHTEFLDYKNGFRGIAFGTRVGEFKSLELYRDRKAVKIYRKTDDDLLIGTASLQNIVYIFVHDKFYAVSLHADAQNGKNLLKVFQAAFGQGAHPEGTPSDYFWTGKVASAHLFEDVGGDHEIIGWIGNNELQKDYDQVMQEILLMAAQQL